MKQRFGIVALALLLEACAPPAPDIAGLPEQINYNWHVRPILSENCFKCHGPDAEARKAGLRLDVGELAVNELEDSPGKYAIVPGDSRKSELVARITSDDVDERMPPASTHKTLTPLEIETLRRWIDQGAEYKAHWAFIKPESPPVPSTRFADRVVNEVDAFVLARLEREGLAPSPEADPETLINRVSLTLTGLPPSLEEVDAFLADRSPGAYERLVDRLLASPRYAEHMSAYWMDLARWSESDGYLDDHHDRFLWPWRDWVIAAFNDNMPFNEFGTWQLAGDLLPSATDEQILATAFLRVGKRTTENGAIDAEYRAENMVERTDNALGTAFLGLTVGCARCHDHKYDPISQKDYYSLGAFFGSIDEPGVYAPGFSGIQEGPTLPWPDEMARQRIEDAAAQLAEAEEAWSAAREAAAPSARAEARRLAAESPPAVAAVLEASLNQALTAHYAFESATSAALTDLPEPRPARSAAWTEVGNGRRPSGPIEDLPPEQRRRLEQSRLAARVPRNYVADAMTLSPASTPGVPPAVIQAPIFGDGVVGKALFFDETNKGFLGLGVGDYDRSDAFSVDFWFRAAAIYENVPVVSHRSEKNSGNTGWELTLEDGYLVLRLAHSRPANMIALQSVDQLPVGQWSQITLTYDGSSRAAGTKIYVDGALFATKVLHDTLSRTMMPWSNGDVLEPFLGVTLGTRFRAKAPVGAGIDELSFYARALSPLEVAFLHNADTITTADAGALVEPLAGVLLAAEPSVVAAAAGLTAARAEHNRLVSAVPQVLVMGEAPDPEPTHVLHRGLYSSPGETVSPRGLPAVMAWDDSLPRNRLGLARWLFDDDNPLTARVFVNRIWQMHFGRGIVETSEDFGAQGAIPTHPELLDWLTTRFVESGWDVKALHKLIVMSATYRQDSTLTDVLAARDAQNGLLARGPRWRMTAEMVRDNALAVSGLLTRDIGGPSAKPYQPPDIWNPLNSFYRYPKADDLPADENHRRTLYTFVKRNALHPALKIFDFRNRTESIARRRSSNTPLQALTLMNDPQFVEAYRELAGHVLARTPDLDERLAMLYRIGARMTPSAEHIAVLREFYAEERDAFANNPDKAKHLLEIGVTTADDGVDPVELAAMTNVAALVMISPDAYTVR